MSSKSLYMDVYKESVTVTKIGIFLFTLAQTIMAAAVRPLPTPVSSPIMNPLPSLLAYMASPSASI